MVIQSIEKKCPQEPRFKNINDSCVSSRTLQGKAGPLIWTASAWRWGRKDQPDNLVAQIGSVLRHRQFYTPSLLYRQCTGQALKRENNAFILLWRWFWPRRLPWAILLLYGVFEMLPPPAADPHPLWLGSPAAYWLMEPGVVIWSSHQVINRELTSHAAYKGQFCSFLTPRRY